MDDILAGLNKILAAAKMLSPFVPGVGNLINVGVEIAQNVLDRKGDVDIVLNSKDEEEINQIITQLHEINRDLDAEIESS